MAVDRGDQRLSDRRRGAGETETVTTHLGEKDWALARRFKQVGGVGGVGNRESRQTTSGPGLQGAAGLSLEEGEGLPGSVPWEARYPGRSRQHQRGREEPGKGREKQEGLRSPARQALQGEESTHTRGFI